MPELLLPSSPEIILPSTAPRHTDIKVSACPHPFEQRRIDYAVPAGLSIAEIVELIQPDPLLRAHGHAFIGEHLIPRDRWHRVRPAPGVQLAIRLLPSGGGALRIVAIIGVVILSIAAAVVGQYYVGPLIAGATIGTTTGTAAAAISAGTAAAMASIVSTAGMLLINTYLPPPMPEISKNSGNDSEGYLITGGRNRVDIWGKVPFVCGRFRVTPPYAAIPYREIVGGDTYWRAIFAIGHGPIHCEELRIGETALGNFAEVEYEHRRGYWSMPNKGSWNGGAFPANPVFGDTWTITAARTIGGQSYKAGETITFNGLGLASDAYSWDRDQGKPFTLYPDDVFDNALSIALTYAAGPQTRSTQVGADEIAIEGYFERLTHLENFPAGHRQDARVTLKIEQSRVGLNVWSTVLVREFVGRQMTPLFFGHRWRPGDVGQVDANKRYDVRITRLTADFDEDRNFGKCFWSALRTVTAGNPVAVPGITMIAMRIRATGQLQGTIDEFNTVARTMARDYDSVSGTWVWRPTSSPAALVRHVLQHPARRTPATDTQIDLARLAYWDGVTRPRAREFNGVFDSKTSLYEALNKIARCGRAMITLRDLRFSVMIDEPKTTPVRVFSPRNSWGFETELVNDPTPHGYRIGFVNAALDWKMEEVVVYDDGYNETNATLVDKVEIIGLTNRDQAWREGRYHLAQQRLRREVHRLNVDIEQLVCERGDLVALQHDALAVGLAGGRIIARTETPTNTLDITLDTAVTMEAGKLYGIRVRRLYSGAVRTDLYRVNTIVGTTPRLYFAQPPTIEESPAVGDLLAFGIWERESLRVIIRDVEPGDDISAKLTLISEGAGVHVAENGPIPPWDPMVTPPPSVPAPVVLGIESDARVMLVTPGKVLLDRVVFRLQPTTFEGVRIHVLYRLTGTAGNWHVATVQDETAASAGITGPQYGETYDFLLQYTHPSYLSSRVTAMNSYYVIGRVAAPAALQSLSLAIVGGQALLMWALPAEIDVQYGGWIMFRHSPDLAATLWPNSTSLARAVVGEQTHVYMPLKPGTYFARTYDADGRASTDFAHVSTKQASLLAFSPVGSIIEDPLFTGAKTNCKVVGSYLTLTSDTFDNISDVALLASWGVSGGAAEAGQYAFAVGMDLGSVKRCRVTSHVKVEAINENDYWDDKIGLIDTWPDIDGTMGAVVDAHVWGKVADTAHGSTDWSSTSIPLRRIDAMEINARSIGALYLRMVSESPSFNLVVTELRLTADQVA